MKTPHSFSLIERGALSRKEWPGSGDPISIQEFKSFFLKMREGVGRFYAKPKKTGVDDKNEDQLIKKATHIAVKMADYADKLVQSDEEWMKKEESRRPLGL